MSTCEEYNKHSRWTDNLIAINYKRYMPGMSEAPVWHLDLIPTQIE